MYKRTITIEDIPTFDYTIGGIESAEAVRGNVAFSTTGFYNRAHVKSNTFKNYIFAVK